jgi:tetratricopeptide (TPR) repeat protein
MSSPELKDTQPNRVQPSQKKNFPRGLPLLIFVLLIALGLFAGYGSGIGIRNSTEKTQVSGQLQEQFQLGVQALDAGQYDIARQHFEAVIRIDPNFPGIKSAYADLLLRMQITPSFTFAPSSTATPDNRSADEQFANAQQLLKDGDWNGAIALLDSLRKVAPTYKTTQIDGMYYAALYQRGMSKLQPVDCNTVNLEGGLYDLTMAERFGPLDKTVDAWRTYVRLYIAGASFWDQDWEQAQFYFSEVKDAFPSLMDSSCLSSTERWRQATIHYADELAAQGDYCGARDQYEAAFSVNSLKNESVYPTATEAADQCDNGGNGGNDQPQDTPIGETPSPTPTLTPEAPTEIPSP